LREQQPAEGHSPRSCSRSRCPPGSYAARESVVDAPSHMLSPGA